REDLASGIGILQLEIALGLELHGAIVGVLAGVRVQGVDLEIGVVEYILFAFALALGIGRLAGWWRLRQRRLGLAGGSGDRLDVRAGEGCQLDRIGPAQAEA